ncbi:cocaine esterase [Melanaphis sacchari]|uniref:cocaine esterase n=1 Tax=Melanaphis sacchari TaxID=742174 RepID=UPI000DC13E3C|nr:cocaine esterase [Melanaphis sacchari]
MVLLNSTRSSIAGRRNRIGGPSLLLAACACVCICGSQVQSQRAGGGNRDAPVVNIRRQGAVSGVEVPLNKIGHRAWTYLGIPFAKPPIGNLRFAPPEVDPPPAWSGVLAGTVHKPACIPDPPVRPHPVHRLFTTVTPGPVKISEDCLYLNVYRPEGAVPEEKFPVMVWFHPGDFHWGTPIYWDASVLAARHKVIVVTTAYRLNILGFYTDNTAEASGNWGLLDQAAALDWVQRNIDSFGGSAQNVTVFGQGSGAVSVGLHAVSPVSRDKFHRAISMSGNALLRTAVMPADGPDAVLDALADKFNCFRNTLTGCLRNVDAEALVKGGGSLTRWGPVVDGPALANDSSGQDPFLPDTPAALMDDGRFAAVPHMIGYNRMEDAFGAFDAFDGMNGGGEGITRDRFEALVREGVDDDDEDDRRARQFRRLQQQQQQQQQQQAATTVTTGESVGGLPDGGDVADDDSNCTFDAGFVVDTVVLRYARQTDDPETLRRNYVIMAANKAYGATGHRVAGYVSRLNATYVYRYEYKLRATKALPAAAEWMDAPHGVELPVVWGMPYWPSASAIDWTAADRRMSDTAMALWTNFARHADPAYRSAGVNVRWDEYDPRNPRVMVLDKVPNMSQPEQEPEFWNEYYPKVLAVALQCCPNRTVESAATAVHEGPGSAALVALVLVALSSSSLVSGWPSLLA